MPTMSPEINALRQGPPGPDPTEDLFKQRFADMAYQTLNSKFAELGPHVVTFRILKTDVTEGSGVGVLILDYNHRTIYIPVVMVDSVLKPMELFYHKELNVFLPLTLQWLDEIMRDSVSELGESAQLPAEVPQDVNIRDLVFPPITSTGRVGYASVADAHSADAARLFKEAAFQNLDVHPAFLDVLRQAPRVALDGVKLAFSQQPALLQKLASHYGIPAIVSAMQEGYSHALTKEAAAPTVEPGEVTLYGPHTPADQFRNAFGTGASEAFGELIKTGYVVKDARKGVSRTVVKVQKPVRLNSPGPQAGWFRLFFADGAPGVYYVIPFPKEKGYGGGCIAQSDYYMDTGNTHKSPTEYLILHSNGKEAWTCNDVVGESLPNDTDPEISGSRLGKILDKGAGDKPTVGSYGVFVCKHGQHAQATKPFRVEKVVSDGGIVRIFTEYSASRYVIDGDPSRKKFQATQNAQVVFVPNTAKFVKIMQMSSDPKSEDDYRKVRDYERNRKNSVVDDPAMLLRSVGRILSDAGAEKVNVKQAGTGQWWVGPRPFTEAFFEGPAIVKIANHYGVSVEDARALLEHADQTAPAEVYVLGAPEAQRVKVAFHKIAQPPMAGPPPAGSLPAGPPAGALPESMPGPQGTAGPMAPGMPGIPGMDPTMMGQMPTPGVSSTDLAIGEAVQQLQTQTEMQNQATQAQMDQMQQQLAMQQQSTEQLVGVLQGIQQRSQEIEAATGGVIPPQAIESPEVAAGTLAPPPMPPPPAPPIMDQEAVSPEMIAQQINPEMVSQVEDFQQRELFDTAAVSMLAEAPLLQEIVAAYVPNLEKGLDNLGRILLTLWMQEEKTKVAIGDSAFISLEDKLRSVFKNLGEIILNLSHNATSTPPEETQSQVGPM